jgi:endonuclease YncB( thermonuclease family)
VGLAGGLIAGSLARDEPGGGSNKKARDDAGKPATVRDEVRGGIAFPPAKRVWVRFTGKVQVLDARTLVFEDGTKVGLGGMMNAPELAQNGMIDGKLYPCGKEAAEFLRQLIGDRVVTCIAHPDNVKGKTVQWAFGFVGETSLDIELVRSGWAISDHEGMDPFEISARENKRGLWRGTFVVPQKWRKGERLPGEETAPRRVDEKKPGDTPPPVVGTWENTERHVALGSLYQPMHGVRIRQAVVRFNQDGGRLSGHAVAEDGQGGWKDNRTDFRNVTFAGDRLTFEFDIREWRKGAGPLAVEAGQLANKGTVRVEAQLRDGRLIGTWKMFLVDGTEVFRGEWEAVRAKDPEKR